MDLPIIPCTLEGFRGVSQSLGHHISTTTIRDPLFIGTREFAEPETHIYIALIGDYNNRRATSGPSSPSLEEIGLNVKAVWTGTGNWKRLPPHHKVKLT